MPTPNKVHRFPLVSWLSIYGHNPINFVKESDYAVLENENAKLRKDADRLNYLMNSFVGRKWADSIFDSIDKDRFGKYITEDSLLVYIDGELARFKTKDLKKD